MASIMRPRQHKESGTMDRSRLGVMDVDLINNIFPHKSYRLIPEKCLHIALFEWANI